MSRAADAETRRLRAYHVVWLVREQGYTCRQAAAQLGLAASTIHRIMHEEGYRARLAYRWEKT